MHPPQVNYSDRCCSEKNKPKMHSPHTRQETWLLATVSLTWWSAELCKCDIYTWFTWGKSNCWPLIIYWIAIRTGYWYFIIGCVRSIFKELFLQVWLLCFNLNYQGIGWTFEWGSPVLVLKFKSTSHSFLEKASLSHPKRESACPSPGHPQSVPTPSFLSSILIFNFHNIHLQFIFLSLPIPTITVEIEAASVWWYS